MNSDSDRRQQIIACEAKLINAFVNKDISVLDELIHETALFVLPSGQTITKSTVLENYRKNTTTMTITPGDQHINLVGDNAIISINLTSHIKLSDTESDSQFRYLRVWKLFENNWKIIATAGIPMKG